MGNFTGAELNPAGNPRGLTGLAHFPIGRVHAIDNDPGYRNELEQFLADKIWPFSQDLVSAPTSVLELK